MVTMELIFENLVNLLTKSSSVEFSIVYMGNNPIAQSLWRARFQSEIGDEVFIRTIYAPTLAALYKDVDLTINGTND